jgi:hypothetical protein
MSEDGAPIPFEDLALQPGEMLQVHSALEVVGDFLPVGLLGYLKNQTLIVTNPIADGRVVSVKEGTPYNVKGFSGTRHFVFKSKVLKVYAQPYPHMHLEYPRLVNTTRIRATLRSVVNCPATLYNPISRKETAVVLRDLSVGGGLLVLPEAIGRKDARYTLSFMVRIADDLEEEVRTEVIVRALDTQVSRDVTTHTMGVQFVELDRAARLLVTTLVYRQRLRKD